MIPRSNIATLQDWIYQIKSVFIAVEGGESALVRMYTLSQPDTHQLEIESYTEVC